MSSLQIDWPSLSHAFESGSADTHFYLDRETGAVVTLSEEPSLSKQPAEVGEIAVGAASDLHPDGGRFLHIPRVDSADEYQDMEAYIVAVADRQLQSELWRAIRGAGAFRRFRDKLADHARERQEWQAFHHSRVVRRINEWLADLDIQPVNPLQAPATSGWPVEGQSDPAAESQELIEELTLLLLYLSSWEEQSGLSQGVRKAWKGYTFTTLNGLEDRGLIHQSRKARSITLTEEGIALARELEMRFRP